MITVNIDKAKSIAHTIRRAKRDSELNPLDEITVRQIPGQAEGAEAQRQLVREKYAVMQVKINDAVTLSEIKLALGL